MVELSFIDSAIIIFFLLVVIVIGFAVSKTSSKSTSQYFLSGRTMPWWLLGISMVATTFSTDTPNLVTDIVRTNGVSGNWVWWIFLLTGLLTVFVYAKLWRRSDVSTDMEFYELRYSGKARPNTWYEKVNVEENDNGEIGYLSYFSKLFKWAREENPDVKLFYNDYGIEEYGTSKNNLMRSMVKNLKTQFNTPIDGVGLQSHFRLEDMTSSFIEKFGNTIDDLGNNGFVANLTELDIRICDGISQGLEEQKNAYKQIISTAFSKSNCNTILIWGSSDIDSWIPAHFPSCGQATPHNENFEKKPAYFGIEEALKQL